MDFKLIRFVAEYTDGMYNFLVLQVGTEAAANHRGTGTRPEDCSRWGCRETPDCLLFDVEGDPVPYCLGHARDLDNDPDLEWSKVDDTSPHEAIRSWITNSPALFIEIL